MNLTDVANVIQSFAVLVVITFTAFEIRARVRAQRFRNYQNSISGFVDLAKLMVEKKELHALYEYSRKDITKTYAGLSSTQKARVHYCDTLIALCETVWVASQKRWIARNEWKYWERWLNDLKGSPEFRWAVTWNKDVYGEDFIKFLARKE